jgi:uncharacterized membrane protein YeaQ/YmgE (transglycosylase-associated protein family)
LKVQLPDGEVCQSDKNKNYTTTLIITCDENANTPQITTKSFDINSCSNTINMISVSACPQLNVFSFWKAIMANNYIFGSLVIMGGIFLGFFGLKFIYVTQIITGILATTFVLVFLLFSYLKVEYNSLDFWLIIAVSTLAGIIAGYFLAKFEKVPTMIIAGFTGYILGTFLYQFFLKFIQTNPQVVFWVTIITSIILLCVIAWFFNQHVLILGTAFVGAYSIIRGISFMAGGFPDERQIIDLMDRGETEQIKSVIYIFNFRC